MANIDVIGWMNEALKAGKIEISEPVVEPDPQPDEEQSILNSAKFGKISTCKAFTGNYGKGAGVFFNSKRGAVRVNGRK